MPDPNPLAWTKASASAGNGACVELAALPDGNVGVRDSKNPDGPVLMFGRAEIAAFLHGANAGEFDAFGTGDCDASGWSAAENAEFDNLYGTEAAMRYRAQLDRVWRVVQDLRDEAVAAGLDPYADPMARRLDAALVGVPDATPNADLERLAAERGVKPVTSIDQLAVAPEDRFSSEEWQAFHDAISRPSWRSSAREQEELR